MIDRRTMMALSAGGVLACRLPGAQWQPKFFTIAEYRLVETLAESIIPADEHSPGARQAGVASYIDVIVANSPIDVQNVWRKGLKAATANQILEGSDPANREFFQRVRELTILGYYSSEIGLLKELDYKGNQAMAMFPGCEK